MRQSWYLFRYGPGPNYGYRIEQGVTPHAACKAAFGAVYGTESDVVYKNVGTRSPKYVAQKVRAEWYGPDGWQSLTE